MNQASVHPEPTEKPTVRPVAIVAFDGVEIIDITGPLESFAFATHGLQRAGVANESVYPVRVLARAAGPVTASCGLQINADHAFADISDGIDTLLIPGAIDVKCILSDPSLQDWLRVMSSRVRRVVSVCTGAFLLAETGLLDRRRATTHWAYCDRLAAEYPSVVVEPDRIFVRDGLVSTSGGVTAGIDLALSLIEEDWGRELALNVARYLVVFLKRPGGQSQYSGYLLSEATHHPSLRDLQLWVMAHPAENHSIESLAERMAMSPRNFARVFLTETGMTPAKFVEKVRIDAARHYLGETDLRIETVAVKAGFDDPERMRRAFLRQLGVNPHDYRERFGRHDAPPTPGVADVPSAAVAASADELPAVTRRAGSADKKWRAARS